MTTRYVGSGGNDSSDGLAWASRKLTLNGVEDTPVVAGDIVYVGPGTYRELLTVDVSGSDGNVIQYIGDYGGANTDGTGGVVRITGSDNDQTATRANCISANGKNYRSFTGFTFDTCTSTLCNIIGSPTNWTFDKSLFYPKGAQYGLILNGQSQASCTVQKCFFAGGVGGSAGLSLIATSAMSASHIIQNCVFCGGNELVSDYVGTVTVKNSTFLYGTYAVIVNSSVGANGWTVNNCILAYCGTAFYAAVNGDIAENYNDVWGNTTDRSNVNTGANSKAYPPLFDTRWLFELTK